jgi:uncharacterized protein YoaH (UPF0181 family)
MNFSLSETAVERLQKLKKEGKSGSEAEAIAAKLILAGEIQEKGVTLPVNKKVYEPILKELETFGIIFEEKEQTIIIRK